MVCPTHVPHITTKKIFYLRRYIGGGGGCNIPDDKIIHRQELWDADVSLGAVSSWYEDTWRAWVPHLTNFLMVKLLDVPSASNLMLSFYLRSHLLRPQRYQYELLESTHTDILKISIHTTEGDGGESNGN